MKATQKRVPASRRGSPIHAPDEAPDREDGRNASGSALGNCAELFATGHDRPRRSAAQTRRTGPPLDKSASTASAASHRRSGPYYSLIWAANSASCSRFREGPDSALTYKPAWRARSGTMNHDYRAQPQAKPAKCRHARPPGRASRAPAAHRPLRTERGLRLP
jgi:hypothetical protein